MAIFEGPDGIKYCVDDALAQNFSEPGNRALETGLIQWAEQCLKPEETFLDIGAHVGTWALPFAKKVRRVVAFEAHGKNFLRLCTGIGLNDAWNVEPTHAAVSDRSGTVPLNVGVSDWSGFGCSLENHPINGETTAETVEVMTIDQLTEPMALTDLCLVKIDVEGHERAVLRGMAQTLRRNDFPPIIIECWAFEWYAEERKATLAYLTELGYAAVPIAGWEHMFLATHPAHARKAPRPSESVPAPPKRTPRPITSGKCYPVVIFSMLPRSDTTGVHLLSALKRVLKDKVLDIEPLKTREHDPEHSLVPLRLEMHPWVMDTSFVLCIDDDHGWSVPYTDAPLFYWCIDSYRMDDELYLGGTRRERVKKFDQVFYAQKDDAEREGGIWLPLAVDPAVYTYTPQDKIYDWCFIGNMNQTRPAFLAAIQQAFPDAKSFVGNAYGEEANKIYNQSKIALNLSAARDVNMRFFEAQATSALLITNRVDNGEDELSVLAGPAFSTTEECIKVMRRFLSSHAHRDYVSSLQAQHVLKHHTYEHRARALLSAIGFPAPLK